MDVMHVHLWSTNSHITKLRVTNAFNACDRYSLCIKTALANAKAAGEKDIASNAKQSELAEGPGKPGGSPKMDADTAKSAAELPAEAADKAAEKPVVDSSRPSTDGANEDASTVARYIASSGGAKAALNKYIASFDSRDLSMLGTQPPCKSYKKLRLLSDYSAIDSSIRTCNSKDQLVTLKNEWAPFKAALTDLINMSKAACRRLVNAINNVGKEAPAAAKSKAKAKGRPKKAAKYIFEAMMELEDSGACQLPTFVLSEDLDTLLKAASADSSDPPGPIPPAAYASPCVIRFPGSICEGRRCLFYRNG